MRVGLTGAWARAAVLVRALALRLCDLAVLLGAPVSGSAALSSLSPRRFPRVVAGRALGGGTERTRLPHLAHGSSDTLARRHPSVASRHRDPQGRLTHNGTHAPVDTRTDTLIHGHAHAVTHTHTPTFTATH